MLIQTLVLIQLLTKLTFTFPPLHFGTANYTEPAISPDGKELVYCSDVSGNNALYHYDLNSKKKRLLVDLPLYESCPNWSPDGKHICFYAMDTNGRSELFIIDKDGKNTTNLSNGNYKDPGFPDWKDNLDLVFAEGYFPVSNILHINTSTLDTSYYTEGNYLNYYPDINDDYLVFCRMSKSQGGIFLKNMSTGITTQMSNQGEAPILDMDNQYIYYQGKVNEITNIRRIDINTGTDIPMTSNKELTELPELTSDNKYLYFQRKINNAFSIWRLDLTSKIQEKIIG